MLGVRLVHLIEGHAESLAQGLTEQLQKADRTRDFRKISSEELHRSAAELYRNLGEWLLRKTADDVERRFRTIGTRRAGDGIGLDQFVWAVMTSRDHLLQFLRQEAFADSALELYAELELHRLLNQFFDRAVYYGILGYQKVAEQDRSHTCSLPLKQEPSHWPHRVAMRSGARPRQRNSG
jgi:hypothetical protein